MTDDDATPNPAPLPENVSIETSRPCGRTCVRCRNGLPGPRRHQDLMDLALFHRIVEELGHLGYAGRLTLHHHSDPLLNRRLLEEIRHIRAAAPDAQPAIRTHGDRLDHAMFRRLLRAGLGHLQVVRYPRRVDAPSSYAPIRVWLHRAGLLDRYAWQLEPLPDGGGVQAVLDTAGCRVEVLSPAIRGVDDDYDNRSRAWRAPAAARAAPSSTASAAATRAADRTRTQPCRATTTSAVVDLSGRLKMCRHVHSWIPAYAGYLIGDLNAASFAELWGSARMAAYRAAHARADWSLSPLCASCADR